MKRKNRYKTLIDLKHRLNSTKFRKYVDPLTCINIPANAFDGMFDGVDAMQSSIWISVNKLSEK